MVFGRYDNLRRIERLDPAKDFDEIFGLVTQYEFPWEYVQGTSIAFMRAYGVPSISRLLDKTGQFEHHGQKRYDDTILIGYEATVETLESPRGRAAIRQLNRIHGKYDIPNDEFRYVLATTIVGPTQFIDAYGWRPLHPHEIEAMCRVTTRFGELMGIKHLPADYEGYERLLDEYEAERFELAPENKRVAEASMRIVENWYPSFVRPLVRRVNVAMLDEPLRQVLGLPRQPRLLSNMLDRLLLVRAQILRLFVPPRAESKPYVHDPSGTYPFGYSLSALGPDWLREKSHQPRHRRSA